MKKWIFLTVVLSLSVLAVAPSIASTAQQSLKSTDTSLTEAPLLAELVNSPLTGLTLESYFSRRYQKQTAWYEVYQPQQRCNVQLHGEDLAVWCAKDIAAQQLLSELPSNNPTRTEAHPNDQAFEITLPKHQSQSLDFLGKQLNQQTQISLLEQVSPLIVIALSCLLMVIIVVLFHWRDTKKSLLSPAQKRSR
ncbi:hypothetical protein RC083_01110 [Pseudoalteromonas haloplanktis]|uniref:Orphan protein n=1 Tax=Pseudoalteromonas haloplanktis TaxID=228 RepID=A0ABU1B6J0_PSEHA|nr:MULTISPECIES: hypothetical protein [Pseudoalteromonas]MDQ9090183.1 hypothetical protein [Pseudoalteromonas haloplanktis]TMN71978.1 hypothetical protein CWB85_08950 [Pseudoalteromonas sp. S1727]